MRMVLGVIAGVVVTTLTCLPAQAGTGEIEGAWVNPDQETGGLTKLEITKKGEQWRIQAWGRCHPEDCDWGKVVLNLVAPSAGSKDYTHAIATWEPGFKTEYMLIRFEKDKLLVQTISVFRDESKRSNSRGLFLLQRKGDKTSNTETSHISLSKSSETLNDLQIYRSKKEYEAFQYAWELPQKRQLNLAYHLLEDTHGMTVYRGSQLLIKNGREEDSFHALARIMAEGKDETHLNNRMGYDWVHSDDKTLAHRMMRGIYTSLNNHYSSYSLDEKKRVLSIFNSIGYAGDYDKQRVQGLINRQKWYSEKPK